MKDGLVRFVPFEDVARDVLFACDLVAPTDPVRAGADNRRYSWFVVGT
jgi:hypothetical protein